jgi:hypothetical protein
MFPIVLSRLFHRYPRLLNTAFVFTLVRFQHGDAELFEAKFKVRGIPSVSVFVHLSSSLTGLSGPGYCN